MNRLRLDLMLRLMIAGLAAAAALTIAACGGGAAAPSSPLGNIDPAAHTVQLNLLITESSFNGYSSGQMTVRVPRGWRVDVFCDNQASTPHSCAIVSGAGSTVPAFLGAASPDAAAGQPAGEAANFSFTVKALGSYHVASLDPGHPDRGMWERFDVVATGHPSVSMSPHTGNRRVAPGL